MTQPGDESKPVTFDQAIQEAARVLDVASGGTDAAVVSAFNGVAGTWLALADLVLKERRGH